LEEEIFSSQCPASPGRQVYMHHLSQGSGKQEDF